VNCNFEYKLITPPTQNPITLSEAKAQLNITGSQDDIYIKSLILSATKFVEEYLNRQLVTQTWALYMDCFPCGQKIIIKKRPLASVVKVEYYPSDWNKVDARSLYAATNYFVPEFTEGKDSAIFRFDDSSWPDTFTVTQAVRVEFIAGQDPDDIPADIKQAILMAVTFLYENRGDCCSESSLPGSVMGILQQNRVYNIGCC